MGIIQGEKIVIWFVIGAAVMACISLAVLRVQSKKITTRIDGIRKLALGPEIDKSSNLESAITSNNYIYVWGWNEQGQLGLGDEISRYEPTLLEIMKYLDDN